MKDYFCVLSKSSLFAGVTETELEFLLNCPSAREQQNARSAELGRMMREGLLSFDRSRFELKNRRG